MPAHPRITLRCLGLLAVAACSSSRKEPQDLANAYLSAVNAGDDAGIDGLFLSRDTFTGAMSCGTPDALAKLGDKIEEGTVRARNSAKETARSLASKPATLVSADMQSSEVKVANELTERGCTNKETITQMRMRLVLADANGKEASERVTIVKVGDGPWYFGGW